jgi:lysophospholipase L1-like esterase
MPSPIKVLLGPLLYAQAARARARAPALPEAAGAREGWLGDDGRPQLRVLIAGDSSAAGVGVATQEQALAGHLTRRLHALTGHRIGWALHAGSGRNTQQVFALLREARPQPSHVAVVASGVNDLIDQLPPRRAVAERATLADWLLGEGLVRHVVFAPLPPVHQFPLLPQPLRHVAGRDAMRHNRALAAWAATRRDVSFVPIAVRLHAGNMASDGFHPGEPVYRVCGEALAAHIATQVWPAIAAPRDITSREHAS